MQKRKNHLRVGILFLSENFYVHDKNIFIGLSENWFCPLTLKGAQFSSISPFRAGVENRGKYSVLIFCRVLNENLFRTGLIY
jgi:hypothetical protein